MRWIKNVKGKSLTEQQGEVQSFSARQRFLSPQEGGKKIKKVTSKYGF